MASFNLNPPDQPSIALSIQRNSFGVSGNTYWYRVPWAAESEISIALTMLSQPPLPEPTTSLPTSGQIWPLGFIEIGDPPVPDDFNIWLF